MRVKIGLFAIVAGTALFTSSAYGQSQKSDLESARELLTTGHADQSLALADQIIAQAMIDETKDPAAICPSAAVAFLQSYMKGHFSVSVANDWCDAMLVKGYALNELERPAEAEEILKTLIGHAPNNAQYLIEYAYTVRANGAPERALDLYKKAEKIASELPDREEAAHLRAIALRGQGFAFSELQRWNEATKAYRRSFKYEPENEIARHELQYIEEHRPH